MKSIYTIVAALAAVTFLLPAKAQAQERFIDNSFINAGAGINVTILHPLSPKTWGDMGLWSWFAQRVQNLQTSLHHAGSDGDRPQSFRFYHGRRPCRHLPHRYGWSEL